MKKLIGQSIYGALIIALGLFVLLKPDTFLKTLVLVIGLAVLFEGLFSLFYSFYLKAHRFVFRLSLIKALLNLFIGIIVVYFTLTYTGHEITTWIVYLVAIELIISGIFTFVDMIFLKRLGVLSLKGVLSSDFIFSIGFGILLFIFPNFMGSSIVTLIGIFILLSGVTWIFSGIIMYLKGKKTVKDDVIDGEFEKLD